MSDDDLTAHCQNQIVLIFTVPSDNDQESNLLRFLVTRDFFLVFWRCQVIVLHIGMFIAIQAFHIVSLNVFHDTSAFYLCC